LEKAPVKVSENAAFNTRQEVLQEGNAFRVGY
jgi:hypothetical protein